jgi:hypothetical protein
MVFGPRPRTAVNFHGQTTSAFTVKARGVSFMVSGLRRWRHSVVADLVHLRHLFADQIPGTETRSVPC